MIDRFVKTRGWKSKIYNGNELYHSVGIRRLESILRDDKLYAVWEHKLNGNSVFGSCCSRNKNLAHSMAHRSPVQFILDKDKIKNHNKIIPIQAEYQYIKNFNENPEKMIERCEQNNNIYYSRCKFNKDQQWDEEFVVGLIPDLSKYIKGIVFCHAQTSSLRFYQINRMYDDVRKYAKEHNLPFAVDKDFLRALNQKQLEWMYERLEEMDDEELEDEPLVISKTSSFDMS